MNVAQIHTPKSWRVVDVIAGCAERLERVRGRRAELDQLAGELEQLIAIASGPAADRGGSVSPHQLLLNVSDQDREHVRDLLHHAGLLEEE